MPIPRQPSRPRLGATASAFALLAALAGAAEPAADAAAARPFWPALFATTTEHTSPGALADGGATLYLTRASSDFSRSRLFVSRRSGTGWSEPAALFDAGHTDAGPALSPDGARLYFHSNRATGLAGIEDDWNLFVSERDGDGWSAPRALPAPFNTPKSDCCLAAAPDGSLYFASDRHGSWDVWRAVPESGKGPTGAAWRLEKLPEGINSSYMEWPSSADVVSDGSGNPVERLLFSSIRAGGHGGDDLYVAFRGEGGWSAPRNLGPQVNTPGYEDSPRVAPDGTLLYATRASDGVATIHAIPAAALELRP